MPTSNHSKQILLLIIIGHVRYIDILTWIWPFRQSSIFNLLLALFEDKRCNCTHSIRLFLCFIFRSDNSLHIQNEKMTAFVYFFVLSSVFTIHCIFIHIQRPVFQNTNACRVTSHSKSKNVIMFHHISPLCFETIKISVLNLC